MVLRKWLLVEQTFVKFDAIEKREVGEVLEIYATRGDLIPLS
tara:strand:+ start:2100 stop:2225 length:126 start_codon:yes stop_codon:yes gene_type:complete